MSRNGTGFPCWPPLLEGAPLGLLGLPGHHQTLTRPPVGVALSRTMFSVGSRPTLLAVGTTLRRGRPAPSSSTQDSSHSMTQRYRASSMLVKERTECIIGWKEYRQQTPRVSMP